jgi:hypothetical protein
VDAPAVPGKWPVVLFSPGLQAPREFYSTTADDLASRGYVVTVSPTCGLCSTSCRACTGGRPESRGRRGALVRRLHGGRDDGPRPQVRLKAQRGHVAAFFDLHLKHRGTRLFDRARHEGIRLVP